MRPERIATPRNASAIAMNAALSALWDPRPKAIAPIVDLFWIPTYVREANASSR